LRFLLFFCCSLRFFAHSCVYLLPRAFFCVSRAVALLHPAPICCAPAARRSGPESRPLTRSYYEPEAVHIPPKSHGYTHLAAPPPQRRISSLNQPHRCTRLSHCKARSSRGQYHPSICKECDPVGLRRQRFTVAPDFPCESSGYDTPRRCRIRCGGGRADANNLRGSFHSFRRTGFCPARLQGPKGRLGASPRGPRRLRSGHPPS
jgi:hypothetical protein